MQCESFDEVRNILSTYPDLQKLTSATSFHEIDKGMRRLELEYCQQTFEVQFNFAIFYAFTKFQENELSNLLWLCECIAQQQKANLDEGMVHVGP